MTTHHHPLRTALALSLAAGALAPAAAQARFDYTGGAPAPDVRAQAPTSSLAGTTSPQVESPPPQGFDWGDAGIGAAGGVGLALVAVGGSFVLSGKRRSYAAAR